MKATLNPAHGSRLSEKRWELRDAEAVLGSITRTSFWSTRRRIEAGDRAWDVGRAGWFTRGLLATDSAGAQVARYVPHRGNHDVIEVEDEHPLELRRTRRFGSERILADGTREIAILRSSNWRRTIDLELIREAADALLPALLACVVLLNERDAASASAAGAAAGGAG